MLSSNMYVSAGRPPKTRRQKAGTGFAHEIKRRVWSLPSTTSRDKISTLVTSGDFEFGYFRHTAGETKLQLCRNTVSWTKFRMTGGRAEPEQIRACCICLQRGVLLQLPQAVPTPPSSCVGGACPSSCSPPPPAPRPCTRELSGCARRDDQAVIMAKSVTGQRLAKATHTACGHRPNSKIRENRTLMFAHHCYNNHQYNKKLLHKKTSHGSDKPLRA